MLWKTAELWGRVESTGWVDGAVEALSRAGHKAWKNQVGDIAVLPPEGSLPEIRRDGETAAGSP